MDEKFTFALRRIALLGGLDDYIAVSSRELGAALEMSQQSASKRILELLDQKYIVRDLGARKQRIKLTEEGVEVLMKEYHEYKRIFEYSDHIMIRGCVSEGLGEGGYYIGQPPYVKQIEELLGFTPFEGTLNLEIVPDDLTKLDIVRNSAGITINGFTDDDRTFGNVIAYKAKIRNLDCAIIVPDRSHYKETAEIICQFHLRRTLGINNGDMVEIRVDF